MRSPALLASLIPFLGLVALATCGLADCERRGCDAVERPSGSRIAQGIAGAAATESDVVANGCQECPLTDGTLAVWRAEAPVVDQAGAHALLSGGSPTRELEVSRTYEEVLDAGPYLVCIDQGSELTCTGIEVPSEGVVTVHLVFPYGAPRLVVFEPGAEEPREDGTWVLMREAGL